jgi:hypothetical protein
MVVFPLFDQELFTLTKILLGIPLWIITGLIIGYLLKGKKAH